MNDAEHRRESQQWVETQTWLLAWLQNPDNHCEIETLPMGLYKVTLTSVAYPLLVVGWGNKDDRAVRHAASRLPPDQRQHGYEG
jgi:hypothetical protein